MALDAYRVQQALRGRRNDVEGGVNVIALLPHVQHDPLGERRRDGVRHERRVPRAHSYPWGVAWPPRQAVVCELRGRRTQQARPLERRRPEQAAVRGQRLRLQRVLLLHAANTSKRQA